MTFAEELEKLLKDKHMTQKELADKAKLTAGYVNHLLKGKKTKPSPETVNKLASALDLGLEEREHLFTAAEHSPDLAMPSPSSTDLTVALATDAPNPQVFYDRVEDLSKLKKWILDDTCQLVALVGLGGIGKTLLAAKLVQEIKDEFDHDFWYSLKNAPSLRSVLKRWILLLPHQQRTDLPEDLEDCIRLLIGYLKQYRCLLVLDNLESILPSSHSSNDQQKRYEEYSKLLAAIGGTEHQSCLVLTSREKPKEVALLASDTSPVRIHRLKGLDPVYGQEILRIKNLQIDQQANEVKKLVDYYAGNPLILHIVSEYIREVFNGNISNFLGSRNFIFRGIRDVLDQQFDRLSKLEQDIMYWLAIEREEVALDTLYDDLLAPKDKTELIEALQSLLRRSLIEVGETANYTLQSVIMEYMTEKLVKQLSKDIETGTIELLKSHALLKTRTKEYMRYVQIEQILTPIARKLLTTNGREKYEEKLKRILSHLHTKPSREPGYAAGNILNLLIQSEYDLNKYDFSHLCVWQAYLQGVTLTNVDFSHADLQGSVFSDTFRSILTIALNGKEHLLVAGTENGEIRSWHAGSGGSRRTYQGHTARVRAVAVNPDGSMLASGSEDQTIRLWAVKTGQCHRILSHGDRVRSVDFSRDPEGEMLVSGGDDGNVIVWNSKTGARLKMLKEHTGRVRAVAFSPDGNIVASGSEDHTVKLWDVRTGQCLYTLQCQGHVHSVNFSPDGQRLATGGADQRIRLWSTLTGECLQVLEHAHTNQIRSVCFSPDGKTLVSSSDDQTIRLWDLDKGKCIRPFEGHLHRVYTAIFDQTGRVIISGSEDQTIRWWDVSSGACLRIVQGYINQVRSVSFNPSGETLASGGDDHKVRLWDMASHQCFKTLGGHTNGIRSVSYSPDGTRLASGSDDKTVRLWDSRTGQGLQVLQEHTDRVRSVAFSPRGDLLASGSEDRTAKVWNIQDALCICTLTEHSDWVRSVAFSPDSTKLATGSEDQTVKIWDLATGQCLHTLSGHTNGVRAVVFSPDGSMLASAGDDQTIRIWDTTTWNLVNTLHDEGTRWILTINFDPSGQLLASGSEDGSVRIWNVQSDQCQKVMRGHSHRVYSVVFHPKGQQLASGSLDGAINLWDLSTGECSFKLISPKPYAGMKITNVQGLTTEQKTALRVLGAVEEEEHQMG